MALLMMNWRQEREREVTQNNLSSYLALTVGVLFVFQQKVFALWTNLQGIE